MRWLRDNGLTLALLLGFFAALVGQVLTGWADLNGERRDHALSALTLAQYLGTGHVWEATFENWESEFLQMSAFVMMTVFLYQRGSPESRRPGAIEPTDVDPRRFADLPGAPWPVRRGGWILWLYERSLGLAFAGLFFCSWVGHLVSGWVAYQAEEVMNGRLAPTLGDYFGSSRFWFESFQNWQSEFLAIASMVWLTIYLRQRGSPESKPVHASHDATGR